MINSPDTLPPEIQATMDDVLIAVRTPRLIYKYGAVPRRLPAQGGDTLRRARYERLPTAPVPLSPDGQTPNGVLLERTDIDTKVSLYGLFAAINQRVVLSNQDQVLNEVAELCGLSMRMTEDQLIRDYLTGSASITNATAGGNGDLPTNINVTDINAVVGALLTADAWMIFDSQIGEDRLGTGPLRNAFLATAHTRLQRDLNALPGFLPKWNYPSGTTRTLDAEWGALDNVRFLISSVGSITPNASALNADILNVHIMGLEAYQAVDQDNFSSRFLYRPPVFSDPLFQNVTLGYVTALGVSIIQDLWINNLRVTLA